MSSDVAQVKHKPAGHLLVRVVSLFIMFPRAPGTPPLFLIYTPSENLRVKTKAVLNRIEI